MLDNRSGGMEQPVCEPVYESACDHVREITCKLLCERLSVWDMCGCVCVSGIPIHQSHKWAALCLGRKNEPCPTRSACHHFLLIHRERLWVGQTHLASHHRTTFTTLPQEADTYGDACIPCVLIQTMWIQSCKTNFIRSVSFFLTGARVALQ